MAKSRTAARLRALAFVLFAAFFFVVVARAFVLLLVDEPGHLPVVAAGLICVGAVESCRFSIGRFPDRSPMVTVPFLAVPALAHGVSLSVAFGVVAVGVLAFSLLRRQSVVMAVYSAGLAAAGCVAAGVVYTAVTAFTLPAMVASPVAGCAYAGFVIAVELLRLRLTNPHAGRRLSPRWLGLLLLAVVVVCVMTVFWRDSGMPLINGTAALQTVLILLMLSLVAVAVKLLIRNTMMSRRQNGLVAGAISLSGRGSSDPAAETLDASESRAVARVSAQLCAVAAVAIGVESIGIQDAPPRRGQIGVPVAIDDNRTQYVVASRDPMDVSFEADDRTALTSLAHNADIVIAAIRNIGGLTLRANTDPLTGLPNYGAFQAALTNINDFRDCSEALAVLFIDLDEFKRMNDRHGHNVGDIILRELGRRLRESVRSHDVVARVGGDEFVVILTRLSSLAEAKTIAEGIMRAADEPLVAGPVTLSPVLSIGLAYSAHRETEISQLVEDADRSMLAIKRSRRAGGPANESSINISSHRSSQLDGIVERSIEHNLLELAFQPIISLINRQIWAFEALLRYTDPVLGPISPASLVEKAKGLGRMDALTRQVAGKAMAAAAEFRRVEPGIICITVNVEAEQLQPERLGDFFADLATAHPGISLCLELNERSVGTVSETVRRQVEALRDLGILIALDDYGSQDSSVASLVRVPMDILKIDRSLVDDLDDIRQREVLVALQGFGDNLEYSMIVEGVDNERMAGHLSEIGVRSVQGFYYGVPLDFEQTIARLQRFGAAAVVPADVAAGAASSARSMSDAAG
jgi:diguanylate cyclase (GGDEF)-like protein